jgi:hypothetical protein
MRTNSGIAGEHDGPDLVLKSRLYANLFDEPDLGRFQVVTNFPDWFSKIGHNTVAHKIGKWINR